TQSDLVSPLSHRITDNSVKADRRKHQGHSREYRHKDHVESILSNGTRYNVVHRPGCKHRSVRVDTTYGGAHGSGQRRRINLRSHNQGCLFSIGELGKRKIDLGGWRKIQTELPSVTHYADDFVRLTIHCEQPFPERRLFGKESPRQGLVYHHDSGIVD